MKAVIVFDVIETLLDLRALDPKFEAIFGTAEARKEWFQQLLQSALVANSTGAYRDFTSLGSTALRMTAERHGIALSDAQKKEIEDTVRKLPAHPDVIPGLERLRRSGFRLATLTNSTQETAKSQLESANIAEYFEKIFSVDSVRRYKPSPEPYRMAASELGVEIGDLLLVAAHAWDIAGASAAGCRTAFVKRPDKVLDPDAPKPDYEVKDIEELSSKLAAASAVSRKSLQAEQQEAR